MKYNQTLILTQILVVDKDLDQKMTRFNIPDAQVDEYAIEILNLLERFGTPTRRGTLCTNSKILKDRYDLVSRKLEVLENLGFVEKITRDSDKKIGEVDQLFLLTDVGKLYLSKFKREWHAKVELVEVNSAQTYPGNVIGTVADQIYSSQSLSPQVIASVDSVGTVLLENVVEQNGEKYRMLVGSILGEALVSTERQT
jgi:DNA-binding PadR family transcriptional regulator